ncbi:MAG: PepSY-associated TM helix domain-containing protein [Acetobacter orientalis]|uniref:PepSY-associated TM helix domain-containing protein n=1 Tax=Acetobacter orientalis TaxID=146474 RepID=UPI0039ECC83A
MSSLPNTRETFRLHMGWLHSWLGLLAGLVLTCIFATGTLSVFDTEITHWMQPEIPLTAPPTLTAPALTHAAVLLQNGEAKGAFPFLLLPSRRDPVLRVLNYNGHAFIGPALAADGHIFPARQTAGGQFFFNFHFTLYSGVFVGSTLVCLLGLLLLVVAGAGIAIHIKALWPNLVVVRPFAAKPRAWLDAHLLTGVLFFPFLIMITYTGTVILARAIFPTHPFVQHYVATSPPKKSKPSVASLAKPSPIPPLLPLVEQAKTLLHTSDCRFILFSPTEIQIFENDEDTLFANKSTAIFSRADGHFLRVEEKNSASAQARGLMQGLHFARFSSFLLRWLYFASGLACTAMMAAGLVLFFIKRRKHSNQRIAFRLGEGLTMSTITGLTAATLSYFLANRLLPSTLPARIGAETATFFMVWAFFSVHALLYSLLHRPINGWRIQCLAVVILSLSLPCIDFFTITHDWLNNYGLYCSVYALAFLCATIAFIAHQKLKEKI